MAVSDSRPTESERGGLGHRVRIELSTRLLLEGRSARFPPELEPEYLSFHSQRVMALMRLGISIVPLLYIALFALDAFFSRRLQTPIAIGLCFGVGVPASLALRYMVRSQKERMSARRFAPWCNLINGLVVIALCAESAWHGRPYHYEFLSLVFAYTFFLGGLRPTPAAMVATVLVVSFGVSIALAGLDVEMLSWQLFYLISLGGLGWLGASMLDRSQRRFWLQKILTTELSISDGLTGLHNHRHLKEQGDIVLRHSARELRPVSLLLIDVDYFKAYNDLQGHLAGDECLRRLGRAIEATGRRPLDVAARYGGEEFAVLMYDCSEPQAQRRAGELREAIAKMRIAHSGSPLGFVTVSIGVAAGIPQLTSQLESFTRIADTALYQAKAKGRNRVECGALSR